MNNEEASLISYRIERAYLTLDSARRMIKDEDWFGAANRLYYAVYQIIAALLAKKVIRVKSHSGAKNMFEQHFIKTGLVEAKWSKLYTRLSNARHESDYADFARFDRESIEPLLPQTETFINLVHDLIRQE